MASSSNTHTPNKDHIWTFMEQLRKDREQREPRFQEFIQGLHAKEQERDTRKMENYRCKP